MHENQIATAVVDSAYHIHKELGPGLLESVYEAALTFELEKRGYEVWRQFPIPIVYCGIQFEEGYRADLMVQNLVIVEIKSVDILAPVHYKQLLTYLKLSGRRLGIMINFNEAVIKSGIRRIVNKLT